MLNMITKSVLKEMFYHHSKTAYTPCKMSCKFLETISKTVSGGARDSTPEAFAEGNL